MKIIFMGTPDFALESLKALKNAGHDIACVFTKMDKPQGRKQVLTPPPVKTYALENNIEVYQPSSLKNDEVFSVIKNYNADIIVVVAYGKMLPKNILDLPKYGCVNVHGSLLPHLRGASPIQWSIVSGDKKAGVTTMLMAEGMDTGDMLLSQSIDIEPEDTAETLYKKLAVVGGKLVCKTILALAAGNIVPQKQNEEFATYAPILTKEMGLQDFNKTAWQFDCAVRGFNPWPTAYIMMGDKRLKIFKTRVHKSNGEASGTVLSADKRLIIACGENTAIELCEVQPEGKKRMTAEMMLNGHTIVRGQKF